MSPAGWSGLAERLRGAPAVVFAMAIQLAPALALAQGAGGSAGGPPSRSPHASGIGAGELFVAWIGVVVAVALLVSLITRRRDRSRAGRRP